MREKSLVEDIDRSIYDIREEEKDAYRMEAGLTPEIIDKLSKEKGDPVWMQQFRLQSLQIYNEMEIPNLVTDTITNEVTKDPVSGVMLPLHCALMRNLGIVLTEICDMDALAEACAGDGRWDFLYTAAPLNIVEGTGAPVNPVVLR